MQQHKRFLQNVAGTDWFVGDIHGEYKLLLDVLDHAGFDPSTDRLFATGDLIDRGPDSMRCVQLLKEPWFYSVLGNHEQALLLGLTDEEIRARHMTIGGRWILELQKRELTTIADIIRRHMSLSFTVETKRGEIGVIHAEPPENWASLEHEQVNWNTHLWSVNAYNRAISGRARPVAGIDAVVLGHVGALYREVGKNSVWIDTLMQSGRLSVVSADQVFELTGNSK